MRTSWILALTAPLFIIGCGEKDGDDSADPENSPPSISEVTVEPAEAFEDTVLNCAASGWEDADGDPEALLFNWLVNGNPAGDLPSLDGNSFNKGDSVVCEVTPDDGTDLGDTVASAPVSILNTPPRAIDASLDLEEASVIDTLTASVAGTEDIDGDEVTVNWTWYVNDAEVASGDSLDLADYARDDTVYAVGTPNDGDDDGEPVQTDTLTLGNAPPQVTELSLDPSEIFGDSELTFNVTVEDPDGDAATWSHEWVLNGSAMGTTDTVLRGGTHFFKGDELWVSITADDGITEAPPVESEHIVVQNTAPEAPTVDIDPSAPAGGQQDVTCLVSTGAYDLDNDSVSYSFAWDVDGTAYTDATDDTLESVVDASATSEGEVWTCTVTPNDGDADGVSGSASVTIGAPLPDLDVDGTEESLAEGVYAYYDVNVINGGWLDVEGVVQITALHSFTVDADSVINGDGYGDQGGDSSPSAGDGTGGGETSTNSGSGGGGYGGDGGTGGYDSSDTPGAGGSAYGSETDVSILAGSGGGGSQDGDGGDGGAGLAVFSPTIDISGLITCSGTDGVDPSSYGRGGGGGSGGGVLLMGDVVSVTGEIAVDGGDGGTGTSTSNDDGGGGGGGRIKLFYETSLDTSTATLSAAGGAGGPNGSAGGGTDGGEGTQYEAQATYSEP